MKFRGTDQAGQVFFLLLDRSAGNPLTEPIKFPIISLIVRGFTD